MRTYEFINKGCRKIAKIEITIVTIYVPDDARGPCWVNELKFKEQEQSKRVYNGHCDWPKPNHVTRCTNSITAQSNQCIFYLWLL